MAVESERTIPVGATHENDSESPSISNDPEPLRMTMLPAATDWFGPALAKGGSFTGRTTALKVIIVVLSPPFSMPPSSVTVTVMLELPEALKEGV